MGKISLRYITDIANVDPPLTLFQTPDWMRFVSQTQNAESVIAEVLCDEEVNGYFYGLIIKRYGLRILGSPFPGWTTSYMGFHLHKSINSTDLLSSLKQFAFNDLNCIHIEIMDRHLKPEDFVSANYQYRIQPGFEVNLLKNEDEIFNNFKSSCRRCIRKADKNGVKIEIAQDKAFAKDYFTQLQEVFAKQNLVPTYSIKRIETLIDNLLPTGKLLLLRAKDREGKCIATGIFPAYNDTMFFFGGASYTRYQILRPNEAIQWFAMRYWKQKGISKYDMGGGGDYKVKYGGQEVTVPWGRISKYPILERLRNIGQHVVGIKQHFMGWRNRIN